MSGQTKDDIALVLISSKVLDQFISQAEEAEGLFTAVVTSQLFTEECSHGSFTAIFIYNLFFPQSYPVSQGTGKELARSFFRIPPIFLG